MIFRRIRGRIVPIRDDKKQGGKGIPAKVVEAKVLGAASVGAGAVAVSKRNAAAFHFHNKVGNYLGSSMMKRVRKEYAEYSPRSSDGSPGLTKAHHISMDIHAEYYDKELAKRSVFVTVDPYSPSKYHGWRWKLDFPERFRKIVQTGRTGGEISVDTPSRHTFLHELGHADADFTKSKLLDARITAANYQSKISHVRYETGMGLRDKVRASDYKKFSPKWIEGKLRRKAAMSWLGMKQTVAAVAFEAATLADEADAWRRGYKIALPQHKPGMLKAAMKPLGTYALPLAARGVRTAFLACGAAAIVYGIHKIRGKK